MTFIKEAGKLIGQYKKKLIPSLILSIVDSFLNSLMYFTMFLVLVSLIDKNFSWDSLRNTSLVMLAAVISRMVVQAIAFTNAQCTGADVSYQLRQRLGNHIRNLRMGFFNDNSMGKLNSVLLTDVGDFEAIITHCLCDAVKTISFLIIACVFAFFVDYRYGILLVAVMAVAFPLLLKSGNVSAEQSGKRKDAANKVTSRIVEYITGMRTFRLYNMTGSRAHKLDDAMQELRDESIRSELRLLPLAMGFSAINGLLIPSSLILGGLLYASGNIDAPSFLIMILMSIAASSTMTQASALYPQLRSIAKSTENISTVMDEPEMGFAKDKAVAADEDVHFEHVSFGYDSQTVIKDVSFTAKAGSITALIGPSGSGKTTIVSLLARFWDVESGKITIGGTDIREINPDALNSQMAIVFQDVYLFADTVYNNIKIGNPQATEEQIIAAAKAARCHDFIMQMEDGYHTRIGEGGSTLSGGEKQRISIARALVRNAPIVLLDETTSNLDADNERDIQDAFMELMKNRTVIVIAHRLNTVASADQILVLKDGGIAEQGAHEDLMQNKGTWYHQMMEEQKKAGEWQIKA